MDGLLTTVNPDGSADIEILNPPERAAFLARLLILAAATGETVTVHTGGSHRVYRIGPKTVARLGVNQQPTTAEPEPAPEPAAGLGVPHLEEPPRAGKGASKIVWRAFLESHNVHLYEDATRDEMIAAWDRIRLD